MTLQQLHQKIGTIQRLAKAYERDLHRMDQIADTCGHPNQAVAAELAQGIRRSLSELFTRLHSLEARLPTPELLSERAYNRMIALGFEVEAAEAERTTIYRAATKASRKPYTKIKVKAPPQIFAHLTPNAFFN